MNKDVRLESAVYTTAELAQILSLSTATITRWARDGLPDGGEIPGRCRFGAQWHFRKGEVVEWIAIGGAAAARDAERERA